MEKFITSINKNLVDSNMFIRALILSLDHLTVTQPQYKGRAVRIIVQALYIVHCIAVKAINCCHAILKQYLLYRYKSDVLN